MRDSELLFGIAGDNLDQNNTREMWRWMGVMPICPSGIPLNHVAKVLKAQGSLCWLSVLQLYLTCQEGLGTFQEILSFQSKHDGRKRGGKIIVGTAGKGWKDTAASHMGSMR